MSRRYAGWLLRSAALALPVCFGGCGHNLDVVQSIALPAELRVLRVRVPLGEVTIGTHDGPRELRIEGRLRRSAADPDDLERLLAIEFVAALTATADPGIFEFRVPGLPDGVDPLGSAIIFRAFLALPDDVAIDVETGKGTLEVSARRAEVRLRTGAGELVLRDIHGDADVSTGDGRIFVTGHRGALRGRSGDPERPTLTGAAIVARLDKIGPGGVDLATNGPSLQVELPPGLGFELDAQVMTSARGKTGIRNGFGIPVVPEGEGHRSVGAVLGGGPRVTLRLLQGWLSIPKGGGS